MSLPHFDSPRDFCTYFEQHDYDIGVKSFIRATGDKAAGFMLEELAIKLCSSRKIKNKAITKENGRVWVEIEELDWNTNCFLSSDEVSKAQDFLHDKGIIEFDELSNSTRYSINGNSLISVLNAIEEKTSEKVSPLPPSKTTINSNTTKSTPPPYSPPSSRGTRIPEDFEITSKMRLWAKKKFPAFDINDVTENFVDYWKAVPGVRGLKVDWEATWRTWFRNTRPANGSGGYTPRKTQADHNSYAPGKFVQ